MLVTFSSQRWSMGEGKDMKENKNFSLKDTLASYLRSGSIRVLFSCI